MDLYNQTSFKTSQLVTKLYSTSFYSASKLFHPSIRYHIFNIYGFVRFADEIVDTFINCNKKELLQDFENQYYKAYKTGISLNPILNSFVYTVKKFNIPDQYIQAFLNSMKLDLEKQNYINKSELDNYIYGSADVVGLMCLKVFCNNDENLFNQLKIPAIKLGSAFQKVNFLRDLKNDTQNLHRKYFPQLIQNNFDEQIKNEIIQDIENDFKIAYSGIVKLPKTSKKAVLTAYNYYKSLLKKIKHTPSQKILNKRIRISNLKKTLIISKSLIYCNTAC